MSEIFNIISPYLPYAAPPILGAFIGYLTNKVAIRMLFRPLKQWRILGLPIPMTPGVIPSRRHDLAVNIGEMVGEHLLTSEEINNSLKKDAFQEHLYNLIESKFDSLMKKDLGPLPALIPSRYKNYFDIGQRLILYQLKETVHDYMSSEECRGSIKHGVDNWFDIFFQKPLNEVINCEKRLTLYRFFSDRLTSMTESESVEKWLKLYVTKKISESVNNKDSLSDILPSALSEIATKVVTAQTPFLIKSTKELFQDPDIQRKITQAARSGIETFIEGFGPMAAMIQNFLDMDTVEDKIQEYLNDKDNNLLQILDEEDIKRKIEEALKHRTVQLLKTPLDKFICDLENNDIDLLCDQISTNFLTIIRDPHTIGSIVKMLQDNLEMEMTDGMKPVGKIVEELFGHNGIVTCKTWFYSEIESVIGSPATQRTIDEMIETLVARLLRKPVGRLSNIVPAGIRQGFYQSIQEMATNMLTSEVPGIVKSLNIRKIVTDRIDSFDLLRLEKLLLSIMAEQFKYINLFGAFLGFLIGCINLIVLIGAG